MFEKTFRDSLVAELGVDSQLPGYAGVMDICRQLVAVCGANVSDTSRRVLVSLFPDWPPGSPSERKGLLYWFEVLFAKPFPSFSFKLNAWVTWWAAQWLMGPCTLEDIPMDDVRQLRASGEEAAADRCGDGQGQQLLVHRCRFLEEAACASVCVNVCKMPTQAFFNKEMGVAMRMEPDYETMECRFKFGVPPSDADEADARSVACFAACPSARSFDDKCHSMEST